MTKTALRHGLTPIAHWQTNDSAPCFEPDQLATACERFREPSYLVEDPVSGRIGLGFGGQLCTAAPSSYQCLSVLPALYPEWLGNRAFLEAHKLRFPYVAGAMARGIASVALVSAMAKAGMLGFFGSAGLDLLHLEQALIQLKQSLGDTHSWGCNLIHSPNEIHLENQVVDLLLKHQVRRISASAFMNVSAAVVRYAFSGIQQLPNGELLRPNHVFAKISRIEVAKHFMAPAPKAVLDELVNNKLLSPDEARLAINLPIAEDITVESDSGGHTDNQILSALLPSIAQLRQQLQAKHQYPNTIRIGAAGGLGTPASIASAFSLGADYVLTGSINQSSTEAGLSDDAKSLLAQADIADVAMCPSADMFEMGVKVQVLKRGSMFSSRASLLYDLYKSYESIELIPSDIKIKLEKQLFQCSLKEIWNATRDFFEQRDRRQLERADTDPKHKMALIFRWYLGSSSRWPIIGDTHRRLDYQIWCGPAMGAFNHWVKGSFLESPEKRQCVQIALNLLEGAAKICRAQQLRNYGVAIPNSAFQFQARRLSL